MQPLRIIRFHFRFLLAMNLVWSIVLLVNAFAGVPPITAIMLIVVAKIVGYGLSMLIERWFYARQRDNSRNGGLACTWIAGKHHMVGYRCAL